MSQDSQLVFNRQFLTPFALCSSIFNLLFVNTTDRSSLRDRSPVQDFLYLRPSNALYFSRLYSPEAAFVYCAGTLIGAS